MTTALDIITDALQELGVVGAGDAVSPEDAALGLRRLNQIMQTWANTRLTFPALTEVSVTLTSAQDYTIGPTGGTVAVRPLKVNLAKARDSGGFEHEVGVINAAQWDEIAVKDVSGGPPLYVWYEATLINGTAHVYPKAPGYTLVLDCQALLTSFASTTTTFTLPDGYEAALYLTLADSLASGYGKQLPPDTRRRMAGAVSAIKRTNTEPLLLRVSDEGQDHQIERGY